MKFPLGMAYLQSSGAMLVSGRVNPSKIEWDLTNGPLSCDRAMRYSGFFGVRSGTVLERRFLGLYACLFPRNPVTFSENDWDVQSPPKWMVFRFHETILRR